MRARRIGAGVAAALAAIGVAACGGSGGGGDPAPAAGDPAGKVPANAVLYASATVRPGTDQVKALEHVVNTFGGNGTWNRFLTQLEHSLSSGSVSYAKDIKPWIGNMVGLAFTRWPANLNNAPKVPASLVLVFPTEHPAAARKALPDLKRDNPNNITARVVGNYVLFGGRAAVSAAQSVSPSDSLAASNAYKASLAKVGANPLVTAYVKPHSLVPLLSSAVNRAATTAPTSGVNTGAVLKSLYKIPANGSAMASVSVTNQTIALDLTTTGLQGPGQNASSSADVGSLPGDSWLAIALPGIPASSFTQATKLVGQLAAAGGQTSGGEVQALERFIRSLAPHGIGQISFSLAGRGLTSTDPPDAGLSLDAKSSQTARQTVSSLFSFLGLAGANVSGGPSGFSIPLSQSATLQVGSAGSDVVATVGYPHTSDFVSPASKLSDNSTYQHAVRHLPSGSHVPLYVSFAGLVSALQTQQLTSPSDRQTLSTLKKLSYVIVGSAQNHFRIVVGLH